MSKQFKVEEFVKLFTKNLKLKNRKLSSRWVRLFQIIEQIDNQAYQLTLFNKYAWLHNVFSVQLLENYHQHTDDVKLMIILDLENSQDEWEIEKVWNKQQIKNNIKKRRYY